MHWWWGFFNTNGRGTCGPSTGVVPPNVGRAANTELASEANNRFLALNNTGLFIGCTAGPPINCQIPWYVVNVEIVIPEMFGIPAILYPNPNDDVLNDNCRDYLLYFNDPHFDNFDDKACIPPDDMDFYYDGLIDVMNDNRPSGRDFISVNVPNKWGTFSDLPPNVFFYEHGPVFSYGTIIESLVNPYPSIETPPM